MKLFGLTGSGSAFGRDTVGLPYSQKGNLRRCIAALSGLTLGAMSSLAMSLGLGELEAKSYLGQPLNAAIDLVSLDGDLDLNTLIVRQVPASEAQAMGIDVFYSPYHFELKVDKSSGNPRVTLLSGESINEPYLNILIELRWPAGVVYREYPVLLDPPPRVKVAASSSRESGVTPSVSDVSEADRSSRTVPSLPSRTEVVQIQLAPLATEGGKYKVQPGDSLSKIAERWREGTNQGIDETMQWLHDNNPRAFAHGNIDQLLAGAILQMPDLSAFRVDSESSTERPRTTATTSSATPSSSNSVTAGDPTPGTESPRVSQDGARAEGRSGLLTVGASDRDDKTRELIDLLVRENESLKERVEKLESSEYLDTLKQLIVLQRQQISDLRSELGVSDDGLSAEMDSLLADVGVQPSDEPKAEVSASKPQVERKVLDKPEPKVEVSSSSVELEEDESSNSILSVNSAANPVAAVEKKEDKSWFIWFVVGAGVLLAGIFVAMYAYYRKLVPVKYVEDEYSSEFADSVDDDNAKTDPSFDAIGSQRDENFIHYDGPPQAKFKPKKGQGDDWMGDKAAPADAGDPQLEATIDEVQKSFENIYLDEEALNNLDDISETSLEALTGEMPKDRNSESFSGVGSDKKQSDRDSVTTSEDETKNKSGDDTLVKKEKPARRPDEEVKMSIAEKMSQYNPDEYRQELESLGFLELDELVDLNDSDEDEVEAVIYRAMMFCEFKKFGKAVDLIESKMELESDPRLEDALERVNSLRGDAGDSNKKVS